MLKANEDSVDFRGAMVTLAVKYLHQVKVTAVSNNLKESFESFGVSMTALGINIVPFSAFQARVTSGIDKTTNLLMDIMGLWALQLHKKAQSLENRIPAYKAYVVDVFDQEKIQEEILKESWKPFVAEWSALSMLYSEAKAVDNDITGKFEESHEACNTTVERVVRDAKNFIGVVSTVSLILEQLPTTPKAQRASLIKAHLDTTHKTGTTLPDNLRQYLVKEHQKAAKAPRGRS